ncbi:MAG TPA: radical SAM protein [Anaerohalosphaeraceae bacterium]|nr:radical SAM protein [Anaerohalosphaeraceae bacterium]HOL32455.1 radical SAM protein [Anaerohalosphaeraceae bacterium]HOM75845.1 radical SAM protein [Anaerohalosphaeraceae bacterium]HPC64851.1 radical SAM protein [Anaerohalosphaeraceae bacterium]HPO68755.1 radical SAM protein [Anaerohalosphaeraceae bacterium]
MKLLLISPATGNWRQIGRRKFFNGRTFRFSMLSLLTVARLSPPDTDIRLVDEQIETVPLDESFDLVGITCMTATAPRAFELCTYFKQRHIPVVLGGFFPSLNPQKALDYADAVVVGPAFEAWPRLCSDLKAGRLEKIYYGNPAGTIPSTLPREMIRSRKYSTPNAVYATMGCRNNCHFCSISAVYKANHYTRPVHEVIDEIRSFKTKFFIFVDDNLTQNRSYALQLLGQLEPLKKHWITQASIEVAHDQELLTALAKAGCVGLFIGLETFNEQSLNQSDKNFNKPERYKNAIRALHRHGIFVESGVIFGFDEDCVDVFERTLKMLENIGMDAVQVSVLTPLPGTPLYSQMADRIMDNNFEHYDYRHVVFEPRQMSAEQLQAGADWIIRKFYSPWRIFRRSFRWLWAPNGRSHFIYPFVLNWAYFGRTIVFGIRGYNPARMRFSIADFRFPVLKKAPVRLF